MSTLCDDCKASGLPILPVRYAVVPANIQPAMPSWTSGERVKDVDLGQDYHYALRTLRSGFVYLFFSKHARGADLWECYAVTPAGLLIKQPNPAMARPVLDFACKAQGHLDARLHHLVIEKPEACGPTWIAFSEHAWSKETVAEYTSNSKLRNARMQTIHPNKMAGGAKHSHGTIASKEALQQVLEYAPGFSPELLPYDGRVSVFSEENGKFKAELLSKQSTRTPWHRRDKEVDQTLALMTARAKRNDGGQNSAHVLALWDAIGITHELNGFRNEVAGRIKQYGEERELEISASQAISGVKLALDQKISEGWDQVAKQSGSMPDFQESGMRNRAVMRYAKGEPAALGKPLYALDEQFKSGQLSETAYKAQRSKVFAQHSTNPAAMEAEYAKIDQYRKERANTRSTNLSKNKQGDIAKRWSKYQDRLNPTALDFFNQQWSSLQVQADKIIDRRTVSLIQWLEAPLLIDTLEDYHPTSMDDGVLFEDVVGDAIFGMGSSKAGAAKIDAWITEAKASVKQNLLWRAIALNQQEGIVEVDAALALAYGAPVSLASQAWDELGSQIKWNKVLDLGKKSLTAFNTQMKAVNDANSGIKPVESMRGLEKIFATVGGKWVKPIKFGVDLANEYLVLRPLLLIRSGASPAAAKALGKWDAVHSSADRDMLLRRLKNQEYYLNEAAEAKYQEHAKKWKALRMDVEVPDAKKQNFNAARDARLALIVAVFEAFNLAKASDKAAKEPGSEKIQAQLTAAKLATSAAAIDVLSNIVKGVASAGDKAVSYQALKLGGGALSAVASGYGAALDWGDRSKAIENGDYRMATLYGIRSVFQATSAVLTGLTALSYCSPLIETFGKRFGQRLVGKVITTVATRLLLARAALIFATLEVSIFILFVSVVIWSFEDDALQEWCDRCAFGAKRNSFSDAYLSADSQMLKYGEALKEAI